MAVFKCRNCKKTGTADELRRHHCVGGNRVDFSDPDDAEEFALSLVMVNEAFETPTTPDDTPELGGGTFGGGGASGDWGDASDETSESDNDSSGDE